MTRNIIRTLLMFALLTMVWGCGDDDPTETPDNKLTGTFTINDGDARTDSRAVVLTYNVVDADSVRFRNVGSVWTTWLPIPVGKATRNWALEGDDGMKTVEAAFKSDDGRSATLSDDIELDTVTTRVLILDDTRTGTVLGQALTDAGYPVTNGGHYQDYTATDFSGYDLVFLLYGVDYGNQIDLGVQAALKSWVQGGGVLVTSEWLTYSDDNDTDLDLTTIVDILPLAYNGAYCDDGDGTCPETYTRMVDHPITEGLPATFVTATDWTYSMLVVNTGSEATNIQVLFEGSTSGQALGIGSLGAGHTIHWSFAGEYGGGRIWSPETIRILINIAAFAD